MYDISANKSFAQNYQTGKGEAQVQDLSTAENAIQFKLKQGEANKAAHAKKLEDERKRATDLLNNQIGAVHPADLPEFQKQTAGYRKSVLDAIKRGGGDMSIEDESALNQQWNNLTQQSLASAKRADMERTALAKLDAPNEFYRTGERKRAYEGFTQSSFGPQGASFEPKVTPVAMYNVEKEVVDPMSSHIMSQVNANEVNRVKGIPPEQSAAYARSVADNPAVAKEFYGDLTERFAEGTYGDYLNSVYGDPKTPKGVDNPSYIADPKLRQAKIASIASGPDNLTKENYQDIAATEFVDRFLFHGEKEKPTPYQGPGSQAYKGAVNAVYNPKSGEFTTRTGVTGEKAIESDVIIDNKSVRVEPPTVQFKPGTNEIIGGSYTIVPTEDDKAANAANQAINKERAKDLEEALETYSYTNPEPVGKYGLRRGESQDEYNVRYQKWYQGRDKIKNEYKPEPIVHARTVKTNNPELIRRLYFETWGKYPEDIVEGKDREGVRFGVTESKGNVPDKKDQSAVKEAVVGTVYNGKKIIKKGKDKSGNTVVLLEGDTSPTIFK